MVSSVTFPFATWILASSAIPWNSSSPLMHFPSLLRIIFLQLTSRVSKWARKLHSRRMTLFMLFTTLKVSLRFKSKWIVTSSSIVPSTTAYPKPFHLLPFPFNDIFLNSLLFFRFSSSMIHRPAPVSTNCSHCLLSILPSHDSCWIIFFIEHTITTIIRVFILIFLLQNNFWTLGLLEGVISNRPCPSVCPLVSLQIS